MPVNLQTNTYQWKSVVWDETSRKVVSYLRDMGGSGSSTSHQVVIICSNNNKDMPVKSANTCNARHSVGPTICATSLQYPHPCLLTEVLALCISSNSTPLFLTQTSKTCIQHCWQANKANRTGRDCKVPDVVSDTSRSQARRVTCCIATLSRSFSSSSSCSSRPMPSPTQTTTDSLVTKTSNP